MPDDGVTEVPVEVVSGETAENGCPEGAGEKKMPVDIPDSIAGAIVAAGAQAFQLSMTDVQTNGANIHNLVRSAAFKQYNELDTIESRANSGVMATPIASPTTQAAG